MTAAHSGSVTTKKVCRIAKEVGLLQENRTIERRMKAKLRENQAEAVRPDDVTRLIGFVDGELAGGCELLVLTLVDTFSRLSTVIDPTWG